jgi:hypothetical protein
MLAVVATICTLRGIAFVPLALAAPSWLQRFTDHVRVDGFIVITSLFCLALGAGYALGSRDT